MPTAPESKLRLHNDRLRDVITTECGGEIRDFLTSVGVPDSELDRATDKLVRCVVAYTLGLYTPYPYRPSAESRDLILKALDTVERGFRDLYEQRPVLGGEGSDEIAILNELAWKYDSRFLLDLTEAMVAFRKVAPTVKAAAESIDTEGDPDIVAKAALFRHAARILLECSGRLPSKRYDDRSRADTRFVRLLVRMADIGSAIHTGEPSNLFISRKMHEAVARSLKVEMLRRTSAS